MALAVKSGTGRIQLSRGLRRGHGTACEDGPVRLSLVDKAWRNDGTRISPISGDENEDPEHGEGLYYPYSDIFSGARTVLYEPQAPNPACVHRAGSRRLVPNLAISDRRCHRRVVMNGTLKSKLHKLLEKKTPRGKCYEPDETNIVVSVTDRSQRDLAKRFDELDIDWSVVENQLRAWSHLLLGLGSIYKEASQPVARTRQCTRRGGKEVYSLMRRPGPPCLGTYCWRDPDTKKHYKLDTSVLAKLVDYAKEGNTLRTHQDVPPWIRELIYSKIQSARSGSGNHPSLTAYLLFISRTFCLLLAARTQSNLDIPGSRDGAVKRYCEWHCQKVTDPEWQKGFRAACKIILEEGLDLKRLHTAQNVKAKSLVEKGVKRGIAI
ncbi:hypothetical protein QBC46DRAFT_366383 [Diplogelasinospora grovesii]|uniref:Uncharacterized protein n=1 Tax=Diplogelasinospora grovesii TaxID=303347 RepID=A0AAN6N2L2_9PEZI|nr:hypothetical protein QBC46DRAFT_366383 [Diplogelasinospora grovesii]